MSELGYDIGSVHHVVDYSNFTHNLKTLYNSLVRGVDLVSNDFKSPGIQAPNYVDKRLLEVRKAVCVAGYSRNANLTVKKQISAVLGRPQPIESLHVKTASDVQDGAFLVPKVILVAVHMPGKKLLDDEGDDGQLDALYDEACAVGAEVMVVYLGLPRALYTPMKHILYHPRLIELVFPTQRLVRRLAHDNALLTCTAGCELTGMQKNLLKEWLETPVSHAHPVYVTSQRLTARLSRRQQAAAEDKQTWAVRSEPAPHGYHGNQAAVLDLDAAAEFEDIDLHPAMEQHPILDINKNKKVKKLKKSLMKLKKKKSRSDEREGQRGHLGPLHAATQDGDDGTELELNMYKSNFDGSGHYGNYLT